MNLLQNLTKSLFSSSPVQAKPQTPSYQFPSTSTLGLGQSQAPGLTLPKPTPTPTPNKSQQSAMNQTSYNYNPTNSSINGTGATGQQGSSYGQTGGTYNPNPTYSPQQPQQSPTPPGQVNLNDYNANVQRLYQASAPIDATQFQPYLDTLSAANNQYAQANTERQNSDMAYRQQLAGTSVTGDFFNNSLGERNRILDYNLLGAGNSAQAAAKTLEQKLALAQALRTGGVEQASVPFSTLGSANPVGKQSLDTFFNLQQSYPDAGISYNPNISPAENLMAAQSLAAKTPRYQAQSTSISYQTLPDGRTVAVNTKDPNSAYGGNTVVTPQDAANYGANKSSLNDLTGQKAQLQTQFNNLTSNGNLLLNTMSQLGVNDSRSPIINTIKNGIQNKYINGDLAQFQNSLNTVRAAYAYYLSRGHVPSEGDKIEAAKAIPDNISGGDLRKVLDIVQTEGQNIINSYQGTIDQNPINSGFSNSSNVTAKGGLSF